MWRNFWIFPSIWGNFTSRKALQYGIQSHTAKSVQPASPELSWPGSPPLDLAESWYPGPGEISGVLPVLPPVHRQQKNLLTAHLGLALFFLFLYSIHRAICHPSDCSVGRRRAEIRTRDGPSKSNKDHCIATGPSAPLTGNNTTHKCYKY